jgi:galactokinase
LGERSGLGQLLREPGLAPEVAAEKANRIADAAAAVRREGAEPRLALLVPGRIEVLGKHTDYAGGWSLVATTDRGFVMAVAPREDRRLRVLDLGAGERVECELSADLNPEVGHWSNYPMTVARRVARNFPGLSRGADLAFSNDLPAAAGMSSSSALMVAVFLALAEVNRLADREEFRANIADRLDLAGYLGTVENGQTFGSLKGDRGVGTFGGSEDHTAILTARAGHLLQYAYCPVRFERAIRLPLDYTFAIGVSGVVAEKTGAAMEKYNAASRLALQLVELWRSVTGRNDPHLAAVLRSEPGAADQLARMVKEKAEPPFRAALGRRLQHFIVESQETLPAAGDALARGDLEALGALVDRSQWAAQHLLGNQVPETCFLAAEARRQGAAAASAFGAGFGGSVWALVARARAEQFLGGWASAYLREYPARAPGARFFLSGAGPAAMAIEAE